MDKRTVGRPPTVAASLYGEPRNNRIDDYLSETAKLRWSQQEMMVLWVWAASKTVPELLVMLPNRTDLQVRRMLEFLSS
jgi:hypothetical protein